MAAPAKLYVGNLKGAVTEGDLDSLFRTYGRVRQIWVARQPPGFAYVTMEEDREADDAIRGLDGKDALGTQLKVQRAKSEGPNKQRGPRPDGYAGGGGYGGGGPGRGFDERPRYDDRGGGGRDRYDYASGGAGGGYGGYGGGGGGGGGYGYSRDAWGR